MLLLKNFVIIHVLNCLYVLYKLFNWFLISKEKHHLKINIKITYISTNVHENVTIANLPLSFESIDAIHVSAVIFQEVVPLGNVGIVRM